MNFLARKGWAQAVLTRRNIAILAPNGAEIAALRRGVDVMRRRDPRDPTSWDFQANIHGSFTQFSPPWNQCQHGSFFFLPWHRMYLFFFERILRAASGEPSLTLPYWDYSDPTQRALPLVFRLPATTANPLFIVERNPAINQGALVPGSATGAARAMALTNFTSRPGSALGFGGQFVPGFDHFALPHGGLESQPHDVIHDLVGNFMGDPRTAARDPIFWLHHANIDRLWKRWLDQGLRQNPIDNQAWMNTTFQFFDWNRQAVLISSQQLLNTEIQLGYRYDDDPAPVEAFAVAGTQPQAAESGMVTSPIRQQVLASSPTTETGVSLGAQPVTVGLEVQPAAAAEAFAATEAGIPATIVLNVEGVDYNQPPGVYYEIYLNQPPDTPPDPQSIFYVGNLAFFAQKMPSHYPGGAPAETGAPPGGVQSYDVTDLVREQRARNLMAGDRMSVTFVMRGLQLPGGQEAMAAPNGSPVVGRVTIARQ